MKKIIYAMTFAGICAVGANAALNTVNGCYQIGTYDELKEFATKVNNGETAACGQVTQNITVSSSTSWGTTKYEDWTPITNFEGYFEVLNGATIDHLTLSKSTVGGVLGNYDYKGLFDKVKGGAVIKNVKLTNADVNGEKYVGGIIGSIESSGDNTKAVVLDNCSVAGSVKGDKNVGGLVGNVSSNTKLIVVNSYNSATISKTGLSAAVADQGGLIGYVSSVASVTLVNCYNTGSATTNPLVGSSDGSISATDVVCSTSSKCNNVVKDATYNAAPATAYNANLNNETYQAEKVKVLYDEAYAGKMQAVYQNYVDLSGVTIAYENSKVTATFTDDATTFSIPQDIKVDKVVFNRKFTNTKSSTIALPFSASTSVIAGAEFYTITGVTPRDQTDENSRDTVVGDGVTSVEAYVPYLVKPTGNDGSFAVSGAVTLKKTPASQNTTVGDWSFITALEKKVWRRADASKNLEASNEDEIGRIYGFAGAESDGFVPGNFVRVEKANIMPMRAYLKYTGNLGECGNALCKASPVVLSDSMVVRLNSIKTVDPSVGGEVIDPEEETTSIVKPFVAPVAEKANRWYDLSGRRLNKKPSNRGSFYSKQAVVK
ncbi:hypothetical protein [Fibrobacter sp. UWH9]|uniref:hypothetical protein n=1 Tax=Fibrobacter sp. UWH9 TaxID=1896213 RepID=UPI000934E4F1|nr:hypothetical protein [Fibrobacter sp. UWH9]